jgi:hypothetical protein
MDDLYENLQCTVQLVLEKNIIMSESQIVKLLETSIEEGTNVAKIKGATEILFSNSVMVGFGWALSSPVFPDHIIVNADTTDVTYVLAAIFFARVSGPKGLKLLKEGEVTGFAQFTETVLKSGSKISWPELLALFKKAIEFQKAITAKLKLLYKSSDGWIHIAQIYLKFDKTVSIADDLLFNKKTKKMILNESKYGKTNHTCPKRFLMGTVLPE